MADSRASNNAGDREEEDIMADTRQGPDSRFPLGFHFTPNDQEFILYYLRKKILNQQLPYDVFNDVNLYEYHLAQLIEKFKEWAENRWYFFTPRDRKYPNGVRPNRKTVDGYWKATGVEKKILSNGIQIGIRKALVFYTGKAGKGAKTDWIMYEYINEDSSGPRKPDGTMKLDEWVLCTIQKKRGVDEDKISITLEESSQVQQLQHCREPQVQQVSHCRKIQCCRKVEPLNTRPQLQIQHGREVNQLTRQLQIQHYREVEPIQQIQIPQIQGVQPLNFQVIHNNNVSTYVGTQAPPSAFSDYCPSFQNIQHNILNPSVQSSIQIGNNQSVESDFQQNFLNPSIQSNDLGYYPSAQSFQTSEFSFENISSSVYSLLMGQYQQDPMGQYQQDPMDQYQQDPMGQYVQDPMDQYQQDPLETDLQRMFGGVNVRDDIAEVFPSQDTIGQPSEDNHSKDNFINNSNSDKEDVKDSKPIQ